MRRADSLEETLILGKIEGKRRRVQQRMRWHHRLNGHEFEQTLGDNEGQGSLVCCSPWGHKESDMTEWLNWTNPPPSSGRPEPFSFWPGLRLMEILGVHPLRLWVSKSGVRPWPHFTRPRTVLRWPLEPHQAEPTPDPTPACLELPGKNRASAKASVLQTAPSRAQEHVWILQKQFYLLNKHLNACGWSCAEKSHY